MEPTPLTRRRTLAQLQGDAGEDRVCRALESSGWQILGRNIRLGRVELDVVAIDPGPPRTVVVIEVRWRGQRGYGLPEETVGWRKRRQLRHGIGSLLEHGRLPDGTPMPELPVRIDLVALEPARGPGDEMLIRHHRAAIGG